MVVSTATWLVIVLLVVAASLGSYLFSQWTAMRDSDRTAAWIGISVGIMLLLAAAIVAVLSTSWLATQRWAVEDDRPREINMPAGSGGGSAQRDPAIEAAAAPSRGGKHDAAAAASGSRTASETSTTEVTMQSRADPREGAVQVAASVRRIGPAPNDPWGATRCVVAFHRDPADPTRWTIENDCNVPVGLLIATCASVAACSEGSWTYRRGGMVLPDKGQRPVTDAEETQRGQRIRYIACSVATPAAINLSGMDSEARTSAAWLADFEVARSEDDCLARVLRGSDAGGRSGLSIDALLGPGLPKNVGQAGDLAASPSD